MYRTIALERGGLWRALALVLFCGCLAVLIAGCDIGGAIPYPDPENGNGGNGGGPSSPVTASYAATGTIGVFTRSILVSFSRDLTADERQYVQENFSVTDEERNPFPVVDAYWLSDSLFRICGLLKYGALYNVDIGDLPVSASVGKASELSGSVTLDVNPYDFDAGLGNSADAAYLHYDGRDYHWVILAGEQIALLPSPDVPIPTQFLISNNLVWHSSVRARMRAPAYLRNWDGSGMPSVNAWTDDTYVIWNEYDMSDTSFDSSIDPPALPAGCSVDLFAEAGDLNGDGIDDAIYGAACRTAGDDRYYAVAVIPGPVPSELNMDLLAISADYGFIGTAPPASTHHSAQPMRTRGDLDGDGFFDVAGVWREAGLDSDGYFIVESSEAQIFFGSKDIGSIVEVPGSTIAMTRDNRDWTGAYAADINGDGVSDLILTSVYRPLSDPLGRLDPEVHVFFGGRGMRNAMTDEDASFVIRQTQPYEATVTVSVIGDEDADGREDIFLNYTYDMAVTEVKAMYFMYGRSQNKPEYVIETDYDKMVTTGTNYNQQRVRFPERMGDIDNDGNDEFMLKAEAHDLGDKDVLLVIMGGSTGEVIDLDVDVHTRVLVEP